MVMLSDNCECGICSGGKGARGLNGELAFGGWKCTCACHRLSGDKRTSFINRKKEFKEYPKMLPQFQVVNEGKEKISPYKLYEMSKGDPHEYLALMIKHGYAKIKDSQ